MQTLQLPQPNAIIFRMPDEDDAGDKVFVEALLNADGTLQDQAQLFGVGEEDSLNGIEFSTIVLVIKESRDSSIELAAFDIINPDTGETAEVWQIMEGLDQIVPDLIESYNNGAGHTLQ